MKSEHRHELETNVLSAKLAKSIDGLKPYTGQIITGIVLLAVMYLGLSVWDSQTQQREQAAWDAFALATDSSDPEMKSLQVVAEKEEYAGTKMQEWAYVGWSDRQVLNAMQTYLYDREATNDRLRSVIGIYENLAKDAGDPQVKNRARFGLGRVYELQNKLDEAREQYLQVRGDLEPQASERAEQLKSEAVREACQWLATVELPQRDLTGGQGATGQRPEFRAGLPATEGDAINPQSLEELLGGFQDESPEENRYDDKQEEAPQGDAPGVAGEEAAGVIDLTDDTGTDQKETDATEPDETETDETETDETVTDETADGSTDAAQQ